VSSDKDSAWARVTGKGIYPVEYARWLLTPWRRLISPPSMIVGRLALRPTDRVLEIGCGPGYFSPIVARALPQGLLTIFDFQDGMLDFAERRLKARGLRNFARLQGDARALPFQDASFEVAFMVTVLGEVDDPDAALGEAFRVLRSGGLLSVTEMFGDPDRIDFEDLLKRAAAAGFVFERRFGPRFFYTANFRKP